MLACRKAARHFELPFQPDSIDSPTVLYGEGPVVILYPAAKEPQWVRVTFEGFDSLRVCRDEYMPYEECAGERAAVYLGCVCTPRGQTGR